MRLSRAMGFAFALCLMPSSFAFAAPAPIKVDYAFDRPVMSEVILDGVRYDRITMPAAPNGGMSGEPALPATGAHILLPWGSEVSGITVVTEERILLGQFLIEPVAVPTRLSDGPAAALPPIPNEAIYSSAQPFPEDRFASVGTQSFRGYQILILRLQPVEYIPASGELFYYPHVSVIVETIDAGRSSNLWRGLPEDALAAQGRVDNPQTMETYAAAPRGGERSYELLILTTPALAPSFEPLKAYHNAQGLVTEIRTTADAGGSGPEAIRAYVAERYLYDGIDYVLIGADDELIPAKDLYVDSYAGYTESAMPGDHYFGCLDGTYNYDGDSRWGEPTDGDGGGDVDLVAEVYVGRASVSNATEADRFVSKTMAYDSGEHEHYNEVLMAGEYLGFGGVSEYASGCMDQMIDGSSADGYTTVGIPSDVYDIDTLYDSPSYDWPKSEIISRINSGLHIINHLGHGSENYALKIYSSDVPGLTNNDLCFIYTQACLPGHFDSMDCLAEELCVKNDNGCFAVIMNARYGWGQYSSTDGPSQRFDREFWDAVFNEAEFKPQIGRANHDSKEDNIYRISQECMRWCFYELNLFGDPTIAVKGVHIRPSMSFPNGVPDRVTPGEPTTINVRVSEGTEVYVPDSATVYYSLDGGEFLAAPMVPLGFGLFQATLPPAECATTPRFYFSAAGSETGPVYNPADAPAETYSARVATLSVPLGDNFETDLGWTVEDHYILMGTWQRGIPAGGGERGDPASDFDGSGKCFVTGNGVSNHDVDGGPTVLTSPSFDLSTAADPFLRYARWFYNDDLDEDRLVVEISNDDGATWVLIESVPHTEGWVEREIRVTDYIALTSQAKLRFSVKDNPNNSITEAAVDAVYVYEESCVSLRMGDLNCDGIVDSADIAHFVQALIDPAGYIGDHDGDPNRSCDWLLADMNLDTIVDGADVQGFVDLLLLP